MCVAVPALLTAALAGFRAATFPLWRDEMATLAFASLGPLREGLGGRSNFSRKEVARFARHMFRLHRTLPQPAISAISHDE